MTSFARRKSQRGAALIVVLLLVATLSFLLLAVSNEVTAAAQRSAADRVRNSTYWLADAGELIASEVLKKFIAANPPRMTPNEGIFAQPIEIEIEGGKATLAFRDATRCFNVNALASAAANRDSFVELAQFAGLGPGEASKIADVIIDYVDADALPSPQGAEDGFYTALPTPFRTSGQEIKSVSELRALDGVTRERYRQIRPFLCAQAGTNLSKVNGNMLTAVDAPFVAALLPAGSSVSLSAVRAAISQLPPGGVSAIADLPAPLNALPGIAVDSERFEALVRLEVNGLTMEERLVFEAGGGAGLRLVARSSGEDF